jgi:hypothetical protein
LWSLSSGTAYAAHRARLNQTSDQNTRQTLAPRACFTGSQNRDHDSGHAGRVIDGEEERPEPLAALPEAIAGYVDAFAAAVDRGDHFPCAHNLDDGFLFPSRLEVPALA